MLKIVNVYYHVFFVVVVFAIHKIQDTEIPFKATECIISKKKKQKNKCCCIKKFFCLVLFTFAPPPLDLSEILNVNIHSFK